MVDVFVITQYDSKSTLKKLHNFLEQKMRNYFTRERETLIGVLCPNL